MSHIRSNRTWVNSKATRVFTAYADDGTVKEFETREEADEFLNPKPKPPPPVKKKPAKRKGK